MARTDKPAEPDKGERETPFDELIERLQKVVAKLESGSLGLEESLAAYEEGVGLARRGHAVLDRAEKRVEVLVQAAGGVTREPLDDDDDA